MREKNMTEDEGGTEEVVEQKELTGSANAWLEDSRVTADGRIVASFGGDLVLEDITPVRAVNNITVNGAHETLTTHEGEEEFRLANADETATTHVLFLPHPDHLDMFEHCRIMEGEAEEYHGDLDYLFRLLKGDVHYLFGRMARALKEAEEDDNIEPMEQFVSRVLGKDVTVEVNDE